MNKFKTFVFVTLLSLEEIFGFAYESHPLSAFGRSRPITHRRQQWFMVQTPPRPSPTQAITGNRVSLKDMSKQMADAREQVRLNDLTIEGEALIYF